MNELANINRRLSWRYFFHGQLQHLLLVLVLVPGGIALAKPGLTGGFWIISIYNIEKSVCDAIKFRNKVGKEMTSEVLKSYLKRTDRKIDVLLKYSRLLRIEKILNQYMEVSL